MVDVTVPTPKLDVSQAPRVEASSALFNRPLVGQGLQELGQGAEALAGDAARQQAASDVAKQGVTLDANGVPQMATDQNSIIMGQAGQEYQQAWAAGQRAMLNSHVSDQIEQIRQAHEGDPAGFKTAADNYAANLRQTTYGPLVGNALADQAQTETAQHFANMSERQFQLGTQMSLSSIQTNIADTQNKMKVIARQGGIDTPEYQELQTQLQQNYDALKSNKLFGYAPARADSEMQQALSTNQGEAIVGQVDSTFKKTGGDGGKAGAQKMLEDKVLNNADLNLSDQERYRLYSQGMAHLAYLTSDQKAAIDANRVGSEKLVEALKGPDASKIPQSMINQAITQASSLGDAETVMKIHAYADQAAKAAPYAGLTDEQRIQARAGAGGGAVGSEKAALDYFTSKGWSPAQASGIVGNLLRESGLRSGASNAGDGSDGSDSIGIGQWNSTRAANLKTFAAQQGKPITDFQTQLAFVQHELETSEGNAATMLRAAQTPQDAASAFALGYERPAGFMTGDISKVAGGVDRVNNAVRLAGGNVSSAPILGGSLASRSAPTSAQLASNPFIMSAFLDSLASDGKQDVMTARNVGEALTTAFEKGQAPSPVTVAAFNQIAAQHPDELREVSQKVATAQAAAGLAAGVTGAPTAPQGEQFQQTVSALQHAPGAPLMTLHAADAAQQIIAKGQAAMKSNPIAEGANRNWYRPPAQIDLSQPQSVPQALVENAQAAGVVMSHGYPPPSMIPPPALPALKSVMTSGTVDQRLALVASIAGSGASQPIMMATLKSLAGSSETLPLAVAGGLYRDSPEAARGVIQGQAILQQEPKFAPKSEAMVPELASAIPHNDLPAPEARAGVAQAARAYYAKLSADANDTTGVINTDRMSRAIDAVTGGVRSYRGSSFIAPWYGASQQDTDAAIRSLTDADFKGAQTADGKPFPSDMIKPSWSNALTWNNWRLQSQGDGKYLVYSGKDDARQYLGAASGGKFVLDLGSKRQGVANASAGSASSTPFSSLPFAQLPVGGPM